MFLRTVDCLYGIDLEAKVDCTLPGMEGRSERVLAILSNLTVSIVTAAKDNEEIGQVMRLEGVCWSI